MYVSQSIIIALARHNKCHLAWRISPTLAFTKFIYVSTLLAPDLGHGYSIILFSQGLDACSKQQMPNFKLKSLNINTDPKLQTFLRNRQVQISWKMHVKNHYESDGMHPICRIQRRRHYRWRLLDRLMCESVDSIALNLVFKPALALPASK